MDMRVLKNNCAYHGLSFPLSCKQVDLSMEYKRFFGDQNQTGLWKAVQEYGKEGTGKHHRALDDALTTYNIFRLVEKDKSYLARPKPTTIGDRIDLSKIINKFAL
jgi:sporulation inhibitor KapD